MFYSLRTIESDLFIFQYGYEARENPMIQEKPLLELQTSYEVPQQSSNL